MLSQKIVSNKTINIGEYNSIEYYKTYIYLQYSEFVDCNLTVDKSIFKPFIDNTIHTGSSIKTDKSLIHTHIHSDVAAPDICSSATEDYIEKLYEYDSRM